MSVLHVFDMDGTLLPGTSASLEIARVLDCMAVQQDLEYQFSEGILDTKLFAEKIYTLWEGLRLTPDLVSEAVHSAPWISGLPAVLEDIRRRGEKSRDCNLNCVIACF